MKTQFGKILKLPRSLACLLITGYQKILSPDHGPLRIFFPHGYCKFQPTCSEYSKQVIQQKGLIKGLPRSLWRILRCNPWNNQGGFDPPNSN